MDLKAYVLRQWRRDVERSRRWVDALYDGCLTHGIRIVDVRHEQAAAHVADAYARLTRRSGVAVVTAGPGV